jgi:Mg2+-importing ATPase
VRQAIEQLRASGVTIKILTGDGEVLTWAICAQVGIAVDTLLTGDEVARLSDAALAVKVELRGSSSDSCLVSAPSARSMTS